ncbi:MAG: fluoride efflux transporter CrcB, partial [Flavobacterium sp.]
MKHLLLVFLGGGLGSALRYGIGKWTVGSWAPFPLGTFTVNVVGSLLIGLIMGLALRNSTISQNTVLLLVTGFCGGFTTYSAFAYENYSLLKNGDLLTFSLYTLGSLVLGFAAVFLGIWL